MLSHADEIATTFGLGSVRSARQVSGGLSNDMWQVQTDTGAYAVKVMRTNADAPGFRDNVERAFAVEVRAFEQGVPCPEPVAVHVRCLADIGGDLVRVHRWVNGRPVSPSDWLEEAGALMARVHSLGQPLDMALDDEPWDAEGLGKPGRARRHARRP